MNAWSAPDGRRVFVRVLTALVLLDVALLGAHVVAKALVKSGGLDALPAALDLDLAFGPLGQYLFLKWGAASLLFAWARRRGRAPIYAALSFVFLLLLADDALELHEAGGRWLTAALDLNGAAGLRGQDLGELAVFGVIGATAVIASLFGYLGTGAADRRRVRRFAAAFLGLAVVALAADMGAIMLAQSPPIISIKGVDVPSAIAAIMDDGTELFMGSLVLAFAAATAARAPGSGGA